MTADQKLSKCWICEKPYYGEECPTCGKPEPWGPTERELRDAQIEQYWKDKQGDDYGTY